MIILLNRKKLLLAVGIIIVASLSGGIIIQSQEIQKHKENIQKFEQKIENLEKTIPQLQKQIEDEKARADARVNERLAKEAEASKASKVKIASVKVVGNHTYTKGMNATGTGNCYVAMQKYWPQNLWANATLVINGESGGQPGVYSPSDDHGCFQIHEGLANYGEQIYNADFNAQLAYTGKYIPSLQRSGNGWRPWNAVKGVLW